MKEFLVRAITLKMIPDHTRPESLGPKATIRYLGLDIRQRSFGFIIIENQTALDCGVRICGRVEFDGCLGMRFDRILRTYNPSAVIALVRARRPETLKRRSIRAAIMLKAKLFSVPVIHISRARVLRHFDQYDAKTKYEIARVVTTKLPELAWHLPHQRRAWETEDARMSVFDAAAAVVAYAML